uniref:FAD/NAD(P)-binding domain-containing protein n=1 Tax=Brugia malayi TaxID=6279 RepID=A8P4K1_BRUMA
MLWDYPDSRIIIEYIADLLMIEQLNVHNIDISHIASTSYKVVVIGGGTGGCSLSHWCHKLVPKGQIVVIDPANEHHFQPGYTFVGGGLCKLQQCVKPMKEVLHPGNIWIKQAARKISPTENSVILSDGTKINYELLIVAAGLEVRFDLIQNLPQALSDPNVCSIYRADLAQKTQKCLYEFNKGRAIFTLPNAPIKCSGAAQKICYLADEIFRKLLRNLKSIDILKREATFELMGEDNNPTGELEIQKFDFIHVAPPCSAPEVLRNSPEITNANSFLDINQKSLQHTKFANIFGIGDCLGSPNKKTAAALYSQMRTLSKNIPRFLEKKPLLETYNCYSSCPLIVSFRHVVLAEFTLEGPHETLPINQAKPRYISFLLTRYILPFIYWKLGVKGHWLGPATIRKILHFGVSKE